MSAAEQAEETMDEDESIEVEVIYALPKQQRLLQVTLAADATVADAVSASGVLQQHPELLQEPLPWYRRVGVFGQQCEMDRRLVHGDRVEIYRPLLMDPKQARRQRAISKTG
ncbi:MAG: RnfH family protein [Wenzhouxiangellaceae bacterium]